MRRPLSRERAREVDRVVAGIVGLMSSGQWVTGRSHAQIASAEGVSVDRVKDWATEAGRILRVLAMVDADDLRARNAAHLEALAADAHAAGEFGDAVRARAEMAKLLGLNAPERHQHEHAHLVAQVEQMPPRERAAWLRERAAKLLAMAERLEDDAGG